MCVHIYMCAEREILHVDLLEGRGSKEGRFRKISQCHRQTLMFKPILLSF